MPHLEDGHPPHPARQPPLHRQSRIAHEQGAERPVLHQQDHRILVQVLGGLGPAGVGMEHPEPHAVELKRLTVPCRGPGDALGGQQVQQTRVERVGDQRGRLEHPIHRLPVQDGAEAAHVVEVRVRDHGERQAPGPVPGKEREDHLPTGIPPAPGGAGVDQHPVPAWRAEHGGIALSNVQKM